jgi:predicted acylesterase/phospholipase RssA
LRGEEKAAASIDVLKVLRQEGVPVDVITRTSMGAINRGLAATGFTHAGIEALFLENDLYDIYSDTPVRLDFGAGENRRYLVYFSAGFDF